MGSFDTFSDVTGQLKAESGQITLTFDPHIPTTTQGTVVWNIPNPAFGCSTDQLQYSGIVIVASMQPITPDNYPVNGVLYNADPTVDFDLHAGDRIGNSIVIGALYESANKSQNLPFTQTLIVNDIKSGTPYYICAFPVDSQNRYFQEGIRAYSDSKVTKIDPSLPATQTVEFSTPIIESTGTNLVPGFLYQFDFVLDTDYQYDQARTRDPRTSPTAKIVPVLLNGTNASTYEELIAEIRKEINKFGNPLISPTPPNAGVLYWNNTEKQLYEFDGSQNNPITGVYYETANPATIVNGISWLNSETKVFNVYNAGWNLTSYINSQFNPHTPECGKYWYNGTTVYKWNGTAWCSQTTLIQNDDPSCPVITCGSFWYDEETSTFNMWNNITQQWIESDVIRWDNAPNSLVIGDKWFDSINNLLFTWNGASWDSETLLIISETQPTLPAMNSFWYNPTSETLKQWNGVSFADVDCLVWHEDPTLLQSCKLWWRTTDDTLHIWDVVNLQWNQAPFTISDYDPHLAPLIDDGVSWFNTATNTLSVWDGSVWLVITDFIFAWSGMYVNSPDPTIPVVGSYWYNPLENEIYQWSGAAWVIVDPLNSATDPTVIPNGTYWYNPLNNVLSVRNGIVWLSVSYVTTSLVPAKGTRWYNSSSNMLMEWNGSSWIEAKPIISIKIEDGKLVFTTRDVGSNMYLSIDPKTNNTLFSALQPTATIWTPVLGGDGKSNIPSTEEIGVGTDGSPDERRKIIDNIKRRLGYPTVQVELDQATLSLCVDRALEILRQQSGVAYNYRFFFLDVHPKQQVFKLTNRQLEFHKIVDILKINRFTSAFLTSAHGSGAYGQVVLQQLYSFGSFDFTTYHLISQYIEQMEILFATRLTYNWNESSRLLSIFNSFYTHETLLLECTVEKTEQELMTGRITKPWVEKWALAEAMFNLSQIRGKFSTLPGASGGVSLNAGDLAATAQNLKDECLKEIEDYVVNNPEDYGSDTQFIIG